MRNQAFPADLMDRQRRIIANNLAVNPGGTVGPSDADMARDYLYWGFSCYADNVGQIDVEYSFDNTTWRVLEQIVILAGTNQNRWYPVTRWLYRITFTDTSDDSGQTVDISTFRANGL